ncbi:hypothetical protein RSAG8_04934, partial [Rhizoctonia solani AG-8 WAC10335]
MWNEAEEVQTWGIYVACASSRPPASGRMDELHSVFQELWIIYEKMSRVYNGPCRLPPHALAQWSLKPIADSSCRQSLSIAASGDASLGVGPQWTFQHVDSTFRNTILSHASRISDSGPTPFPISRKLSLPSSNQRPSIIIGTPATPVSEMGTRAPIGPITAMFPPRERVRGLDSPMLGLFDTLLPLSPALSSSQLRLVPPRAWSPTPNRQLQQPPPPAGSGTSTPRPPSVLHPSARVESSASSEPEETPSLRQTLDSLDQRLCELLEERKLFKTGWRAQPVNYLLFRDYLRRSLLAFSSVVSMRVGDLYWSLGPMACSWAPYGEFVNYGEGLPNQLHHYGHPSLSTCTTPLRAPSCVCNGLVVLL